MIRVHIDPDTLWFRMEGHADFGPVGSDIVCAAATMLASTLISSTHDRVADGEVQQCCLQPGKAMLHVTPKRRKACEACKVMFESTHRGFRLLAQSYPDNIIID